MQVKKYRGKTINDALARVKNVLGPEAMIISTKKLRERDGYNGFEVAAMQARDDISDTSSSPYMEVKSELMSIKEMIYLLNHSGGITEALMMNPGTMNLYAKLIRNGVDDHYARMFLERAGVIKGDSSYDTNSIKKKTIKEIMKVVGIKNPFDSQNGRQIIAAFIGTTGVGKTTTIAKLAAQLMFTAKRKVGLISIDNYRIGAMEQLKTYASILGIPCFPAFNRKDLLFALKRMGGRDVVLIDTAGQSHYDKPRITELKNMIAGDPFISSHLLMSVSTTDSEMSKAATNFSPLEFQSYIFTKIDEAERCGSVINQIMKLPLPISYITTGQNVPEDIERANKKRILNLLFNKNLFFIGEQGNGSSNKFEKDDKGRVR
ncbi:MAG: protein FlhF [Deltaproteobacteria bacterium]|nr:protein FlhF [Deltaproteobacteria bacterium]RLB20668.1 MAG: protein FlhF [Deltaproteobacteria bacterium]